MNGYNLRSSNLGNKLNKSTLTTSNTITLPAHGNNLLVWYWGSDGCIYLVVDQTVVLKIQGNTVINPNAK